MPVQNPTILSNATRFRPYHEAGGSRSPSRSPYHRTRFTAQELDPLLDNLSPDATLHALSSADAVASNSSNDKDILARSISVASAAERALAIRAAFAAQKLKQWYKEVSMWEWPAPKERALGKGFLTPPGVNGTNPTDGPGLQERYLGCLPALVVKEYESRLEEIQDGMEDLQVEELKEHVLNAHIPAKTRPLSMRTPDDPVAIGLHYFQLGDLTAVITATIVQALPYLARLSNLLTTWDVRLSVLKQTPRLLERLQRTRASIEAAFSTIYATPSRPSFTKAQLETSKAALETEVSVLGVAFDKLLDQLEGSEDSLPSAWIDEMDNAESDFANWVVEAERLVSFNQWPGNFEKIPEDDHKKSADSILENRPPIELSLPSPSRVRSLQMSNYCSHVPSEQKRAIESDGRQTGRGVNHVTSEDLQKASTLTLPVDVQPSQKSGPSIDNNSSTMQSRMGLNGTSDLQALGQLGLSARSPIPREDVTPSIGDLTVLRPVSPLNDVSRGKSPEEPITTPQSILEDVTRLASMTLQTELYPSPKPAELPNHTHAELWFPTREASSTPMTEDSKKLGGIYTLGDDNTAGDHLPSPRTEESYVHSSPTMSFNTSIFTQKVAIQASDMDLDAKKVRDNQFTVGSIAVNRGITPAASPSKGPFHFPVHPPKSVTRDLPTKPPPLQLPLSNHKREISEVSVADSMLSDTFSDISNAEIVDARTEVLGTPTINVVDNPFRASRDDMSGMLNGSKPRVQSMHLPETLSFTIDPTVRNQRTKSLTLAKMPVQSPALDEKMSRPPVAAKDTQTDDEDALSDTEESRPSILHRASMSSMELISKNQVRRIVVSRQSSHSSATFLLADGKGGPGDALRALMGAESVGTTSPVETDRRLTPTSFQRSHSALSFDRRSDYDDFSPLARTSSSQRTTSFRSNSPISPPLRGRSSMRISHGPSNLNGPVAFSSPENSPPSSPEDLNVSDFISSPIDHQDGSELSQKQSRSSGDSLEAKIQDLLTTLPTPIRLTSNSYPSHSQPPPATANSVSSPAPAPSLTLSLAEPERTNRRTYPATADVRVYHLSYNGQSRATPPTKLLVRLVGENGERVMVRVGGGWADLGEYLREYSLHHGKGSISESRIEVSNLPTNGRGGFWETIPASSTTHSGISKVRSKSPSSRAGAVLNLLSNAASEDLKKQPVAAGVLQHRSAEPHPTSAASAYTSDRNEFNKTWTPPSVASSRTTFPTHSELRTPTRTAIPIARSLGSPLTSLHVETPTPSPVGKLYSSGSSVASSNQKYTPLGAAGPRGTLHSNGKSNDKKKAIEHSIISNQEGERRSNRLSRPSSWATGEIAPSSVTSTSVNATVAPAVAAASTGVSIAANKTSGGLIPVPSGDGSKSVEKRKSMNRLSSLGDVGGIRRVFLRKKDR